jgi:large subunit ribosomal protein L16
MSQLVPKRTKYRKMQKGNNRGTAYRGSNVDFGDFGMQATEPGRLTARQIEAARMAITRHVKRAGKLWIRIFPHRPVTAKPLEVRMGGGKGSVEEWAADILPGRVMYEISGIDEKTAREAFRLAGHKIPVGYKFLIRGIIESNVVPNAAKAAARAGAGAGTKLPPPARVPTEAKGKA